MTSKELCYPIITLSDEVLSYARDNDELTTCSFRAVNRWIKNNVLIIDSSSHRYRVTDAQVLRVLTPFWKNILGDKRVQVELTIEQDSTDPFTPAELKEYLTRYLIQHTEALLSLEEGEFDITDLDTVSTIEGIMKVVDNWMGYLDE